MQSDSESQSIISESEDLDLRLQLLIAEARPLLKDVNRAIKDIERVMTNYHMLDAAINKKLTEAIDTYRIVKETQDSAESRLVDLLEMMQKVRTEYQKLTRAQTIAKNTR